MSGLLSVLWRSGLEVFFYARETSRCHPSSLFGQFCCWSGAHVRQRDSGNARKKKKYLDCESHHVTRSSAELLGCETFSCQTWVPLSELRNQVTVPTVKPPKMTFAWKAAGIT